MSDKQFQLEAFAGTESVAVAAKRLGVGRDRLARLWKAEFGAKAFRERGNRLRGLANSKKGRQADPRVRLAALEAFATEEPLKEVAKRLGVHHTKIREWWHEAYGELEVKERAARLQQARTQENNKQRSGPRKIRQIEVPCDRCGISVIRSAISVAKSRRILCEGCDAEERGADTPCSVCGVLCVGAKGLAMHYRHTQDEAHRSSQVTQKKGNLGVAGVDHVVCQECGHQAKNLWRHLETEHGWTPTQYVERYPKAQWRIAQVEKKRVESSVRIRVERGYSKGERKEVQCPTCSAHVEVSLFVGALHDLRCEECKAEDELILWRGKRENQDFVVCQECGHRAVFLLSHINSAHDLVDYKTQHPGALLTAWGAGQREPPSNKLVLTVTQLEPFMDDKDQVIAAAAAKAFDCAQWQIRRNCRELGLKTRNKLAWQKAVLDRAAQHLGEGYEWEWSDPRIRGTDSDYVLHFDGYFPSHNLIIEAHGDQHFFFIEKWHRTYEGFEAQQALDRSKQVRARELGYTIKVVRYSDPIHDPEFWRRLLGQDTTLWANKSDQERNTQIQAVLSQVRKAGFPEIVPSAKTQAEFTKLQAQEVFVDGERSIKPHSHRGTTVCASFFPNRYRAKHRSSPSVREAWDNDARLSRAIRVQLEAGHPTTPQRVLKALQMTCRTPSVFRPLVAKYVCQTYAPGGVVWDPCMGFGGRLFGALAAGVKQYVGTDIEPETVEGNRRLATILGMVDRCVLVERDAARFDPQCELDLVFTSPPYFNLEEYGPFSTQGRYESVEEWLEGFLEPLVATAKRRLKPGGYLVLNLPVHPVEGRVLADEGAKISQAGFTIEPAVFMPIRRLRKGISQEPLLVFRK